MARNASGTHSLPAGNPVVTNTTIDSSDFNDTMNDLSAEITDSLSRSGKGPMQAALELVAGTVGTPALSWDAEANTGLYRAGAADIRLSIAGTDRAKATATSWFYDMVTALTATSLSLKGAVADGAAAVGIILDNTVALANATAKAVSVRVNGTEQLAVDRAGAVLGAAAGATLSLKGTVADGASAVGVVLDNTVALANATAKCTSVRSNGSEKAYVYADGQVIGLNTWHMARKTADQSTTSSTFQNVTGLSFAVSANGEYEWEAQLIGSCANAATVLQYGFSGPAAPTHVIYQMIGTTQSTGALATYNATAFAGALTAITGGTAMELQTVRGRLRNGANAGTVQLQFLSFDNTNNVTISQASTLNWRRIDAVE